MAGKIAVRNIPDHVWEGLEILAQQHERSTEAEARYALRAWVEPLMQRKERSVRRIEVSSRLRDLLEQVNEGARRRSIKPSHIAQEIGEAHAENVENWFLGETEPSFGQLEAIAKYLGGVSAWLQHGDYQMFPVESTRIPEEVVSGVAWLLGFSEPERVSCLHLVRESSEAGSLAVIKQYGSWRCKTYITPYHVSEQIGAGGESSLAYLSLIFELLYKSYTKLGADINVKSYILPRERFKSLLDGKTHPLSALRNVVDEPWWEDFWDAGQFRDREYWPGWRTICERIHRIVESKSGFEEQLKLIREDSHSLLARITESYK